MNIIEKAKNIALSDLRSCYNDKGILASQVNFVDFWARDSFWASLGLVESELDLDKVKSSLELFLNYQHTNGKIPRKICLDYNGLRYIGVKIKRKKPRPIYTSSIKWFFSFDDNLLFVIAFCKYIEKTKDYDFAKKHYAQVKKALTFYVEKKLIKQSLLYEFGFGNWMDTIFKKGFVLYTNCLWYKAMKEFEDLSTVEMIHESSLPDNLPSSQTIYSQIQKLFWLEEGYFADTVHANGKQQKYFDLAGNVLAILFDVATPEQAEKIFKKIDEIQKDEIQLHPLNHPHYPFWKISPVCFPLNIQDYQNQISWSWIEALLAVAYIKNNKTEKAKKTLENLSNLMVKHGHIHETYYLDGKPFNHLLWKSAVPFAWGAGLFLYAAKKLENNLHFKTNTTHEK